MNGLEFHTKVVPKTSIFNHLALLLTFDKVQKRPLPEHCNPVCYPVLVKQILRASLFHVTSLTIQVSTTGIN